MKILIAYVSHGRQTEKVAQRIERTLSAGGHHTDLVDLEHAPAGFDPRTAEALVLAAPIYAAGYPRAARSFARRHADLARRIPCAFVSVGLAVASKAHDGRAQTMEVVRRFVARTGFDPARVELVAGALLYTQYNFLKRYIMLRIARAEGGDTDTSRDFEYTDWAAVDRFATEFAAAPAAAKATTTSSSAA